MSAPKKKVVPKFGDFYAVIRESEWPQVLIGEFCDVELLGWDKDRAKAVKAAKEEARYLVEEGDAVPLLVINVQLEQVSLLVPPSSEEYTEKEVQFD